MSAELEASRQQLAQVEAALLLSPDDENLKSLAQGLKEVIALQAQLTTASDTTQNTKVTSQDGWTVGDTCEAVWSEDGNYYPAEIVAFEGGDQVRVRYTEYDEEDVVQIKSLRRTGKAGGDGAEAAATDQAAQPAPETKTAKTRASKESDWEQKRKKAKRKKEKESKEMKKLEQQKNKWQSFAAKTKRKKGTGSGKHGKSIFASPDDPNGKVGVGTCGIGGRGMTDYQNRGKWKFESGKEERQ
ncbi:hypothetical protein PTSG_01988 [Salpingoeca rosetta]|uniref:Survival of motor neuron-related-splicing factor 30 n=1 Tax=Salpingoeca rosetta (strain ATCC 50818 / BSB-021) TaxID=946362 RepID=F2TZJ5_SALR5|nr:uncharacterized protein PTSG_01988 [Salpingoeca rosetta]EGD79019.1 hypothetical protein PTSG_01988 [Salpingoeca rosetta]|eukprot:XP_004997975.1 hypothetical protein PTSG_01988 [Salpingoeca rosetta]